MPKKDSRKKQVKKSEFDYEELMKKTSLTKSELESLKDVFDMFDLDSSGTIEKKEMKKALESLFGEDNELLEESKSKVYGFDNLMNDLDENEDGVIDFEEFVSLMTNGISLDVDRESTDKVHKIFCVEEGEDGFTKDDLRKIADELNIEITDKELEKMIKIDDKDEDEKINADEFYDILNQLPTTVEEPVPKSKNSKKAKK